MDVVVWVLRAGLVAWIVALFVGLIVVSVLATVYLSERIKARVWDARVRGWDSRVDDHWEAIKRAVPDIRNRP